MNNPTLYVIAAKDELDTEHWEVGSNFDWCKERAMKDVENYSNTRVVYKLVPLVEYSLEVTTKIITKELSENEKLP